VPSPNYFTISWSLSVGAINAAVTEISICLTSLFFSGFSLY